MLDSNGVVRLLKKLLPPPNRGSGRRVWRLVIGLATAAGLCVIVSAQVMPDVIDVEVGKLAQRDIYSPRSVTYEDKAATEEARQRAADSTPRVYDDVQNVAYSQMEGGITLVMTTMRDVERLHEAQALEGQGPDADPMPAGGDGDDWNPVDAIMERLRDAGIILRKETVEILHEAPADDLSEVETLCLGIIELEALTDLRTRDDEPSDTNRAEARIKQRTDDAPLSADLSDASYDVCRTVFVPNQRFNPERWAQEKQVLASEVEAVTKTIQQGELIIAQGRPVDEQTMVRLQETGLLRPTLDYGRLFSRVVMTALAILIIGMALQRYSPDVFYDLRRLATLSSLTLLAALIANLAMSIREPRIGLAVTAASAATCGAVSMLMFGPTVSLLLAMALALSAAMIWGSSATALFAAGCGGLVGLLASERLTRIGASSLKVGLVVGVAILVSQTLVAGQAGTEVGDVAGLQRLAGWSLALGLAAVLSAQFATRLLEGPLDILTEMRLLELSDPRSPLLHQTMVEAPGTYNSALQVANLAGTAAERVGANELLVRVGSMYHDIGKLKYPHFFTENQFGGLNPHDNLTPSMSALVIISHVKEGLERGVAAGLPRRILDFVAEHHGTTMIEYFYHKACEQEGSENVPEERFRYPGPRPRSRETAIMMIADSVEATVRSMKEPTPSKIDSAVRGIVHNRMEAGQLDESDLTLKDIEVVTETLVRTLQGIYHTRIEYPGTEELLRQGAQSNGSRHDGRR